MKARCPDCDELVGITQTGKKQNPGSLTSSEWQRLDAHPSKEKTDLCVGSGKLV